MKEGHLRIGELSRRVGVSPELLRAWEGRYGLLQPTRSAGGFRLYSEADEDRIKRMRAYQDQGLSAAEAARLALEPGTDQRPAPESPALDFGVFAETLESFDEPAAQAAFDRALQTLSLDALLRDLLLPYLHDLGERWEAGTVTVAQEHFASNVVRGRLLGLARGWGQGAGPLAVLACAPGEQHDLALIAFGLALRARGWRIAYLGPDTPVETLRETAQSLEPRVVVVSATASRNLSRLGNELVALGRDAPLALAGAGATPALAEAAGAALLSEDPVTEADRVATGLERP
ncbi:MAG TPA: cobalamin B12-binding domain-containing protein [Gaiellaceae bacterium]|jgi:MerR family transcriptional regulator, light-induced transcriptional regulator|nr:cobalamin B12-binding domain-containing protein [Gaiellaceae bacterium]